MLEITFLRAVNHAIDRIAGKRVIDRGVVFQQPIQFEEVLPAPIDEISVVFLLNHHRGRPAIIRASASGLMVGFADVGA